MRPAFDTLHTKFPSSNLVLHIARQTRAKANSRFPAHSALAAICILLSLCLQHSISWLTTNHLHNTVDHLQVLQSASRLANRRPFDVLRLLQTNPSATLTGSGAIVFGCNMHPEGHITHSHSKPIHERPRAQQQQTTKQQQQGQSLQLHPGAALSAGQGLGGAADTQQAFALHSRPSATRKLHLEFQGCVTQVGRCNQGCPYDSHDSSRMHAPMALASGIAQMQARQRRCRCAQCAAQPSCKHQGHVGPHRPGSNARDRWDKAVISSITLCFSALCVQKAAQPSLRSRPGRQNLFCTVVTAAHSAIPHMQGTDGWNKYYGVETIITPPYDTDGNATTFSEDERHDIITIHAGT